MQIPTTTRTLATLSILIIITIVMIGILILARTAPESIVHPQATSTFPIMPDRPPLTATTTQTPTPTASTTAGQQRADLRPLPEDLLNQLLVAWDAIGDEGALLGSSTPAYSLTYSKRFDRFISTISVEPAAQYRHEMEQKLVESLGLSEEEVCLLDVRVKRRTKLTYGFFQTIGLSFCPNSVPDSALLLPYYE